MITGLTQKEAEERLKKYGPNVLREQKRTPLFLQFLGEFKELMIIILILAGLISYFLGDRKDAVVIFVIVLINVSVGFFQKYKAEKAIEALKKLLTQKARVIRDGKEMVIDAAFLVPGDLILIGEGDKVPADASLIEENEIHLDEAVLTGESIPVPKDVDSKICMGTQITHGTGRAVVTATGMQTEFGKIAKLTTETKKDLIPLQKELRGIGLWVGKVTLGLVTILIIGGVFIQKRELIDTIIFAASVAVAAVPEGLPTTITIALALGVQRLSKQKAIMRQLASVETLGSTTVICSDKTGTITKNELTVTDVILEKAYGKVSGVGYEPSGALQILPEENPEVLKNLEKLSLISGLCNNATLQHAHGKWQILGDPTEGALLTFLEKIGFAREKFSETWEKIHEIPFNPEQKRMTVIYKKRDEEKYFAFTKGAPESVLSICNIEDSSKRRMLEKNDEMALSALRMLAFAYREVSRDEIFDDHKKKKRLDREKIEQNLIFTGMLGMIDPPRREVKEAVRLTKKAGVKIYVITGDHGLTARAITEQVGIIEGPEVRIITGGEFETLSDETLLTLLKTKKDVIFARMNPGQKLRIVEALKKMGEVVAVTGDGVNDAPALKRADIGVAMGQTGTDVTREAANMVLADDSFSTIVTAIQEGRTIYENMKKFIYYIFSSNIAELFVVFIPLFFGMIPPLTAVLILAVNVGTDIFPALALGIEPAERDIMDHPPRKPASRIMNRSFVNRYLINGLFAGLVVTLAYFWTLFHEGWKFGEPILETSDLYIKSSTFAFITLVMLEMANAFNGRSARQSIFRIKFFSNPKLILAILASIILTIAFTTIPLLQHALETEPLDLKEWGLIIAVSLSIIIFDEVRKYVSRQKIPRPEFSEIS